GESVSNGLLLGLLEGKGIVKRAGNEVGQGAKKQNLFLREFDGEGRFDVQNAVQLLGVEHRESDSSNGIRQKRLMSGLTGRGGLVVGQLAAARDMADEATAQGNAPAESSAASAGFGLHHELAGRVFEHADADMIVG